MKFVWKKPFYLNVSFIKRGNIEINKILILAIFTPVFILYPVAEIEVLARKETFIFCIYLLCVVVKNNTIFHY